MKLKISKSEHTRLIRHAKSLLKLKQEAKWEICRIALKVCFFANKKGGRMSPDSYSITNFAEEINMNRKTLSCWILDYESVYNRLDLDDSKMNYSQKKLLGGTISRTRAKLYNFNEIKRGDIKSIDIKTVRKTFDSFLNIDPVLKRMRDFNKTLKHHLYSFKHEEFSSIHRKELISYQETLAEVSIQLKKAIRETRERSSPTLLKSSPHRSTVN